MDPDLLVKQFQKKNIKAFETLYYMYRDSLSGVIFSIVRDPEASEEILNDTFVKAWKRSADYSPSKGRFFTWMLNIARNAAIDRTRSAAYKHGPVSMDTSVFADVLESDDDLDQRTDAIGIRKVVKRLADKCKKIINAIYFRGYTQKEAAEALDIPLGTVKTRNRNCIKELRNMLDG